MRVAVVGTGHVGLVTCVAMSTMGHEVIGLDADEEKLTLLRRGIAPFHEDGLQEALDGQLAEGRLQFTDRPDEAFKDAAVVFVCVGTRAGPDGEADLTALELAGITIARKARNGVVVVEKSMVPAGTAELLHRTLMREGAGLRFDVASNPEFLREGKALQDALSPDRIVIGVESERSALALRAVYEPLTRRGVLLIETDIRTAELAKHASNSFLALKISFANALARLCERIGTDVEAVVEVMGSDSRIGRAFLNAGLGYGGYCLPKDVMGLERLSARFGYDWPLLREVDRLNREAIESTIAKVRDAVWNIGGKRIAVLGLAFKPGTDDARFSPALELSRRLIAQGASIVAYDPLAAANAKDELPELEIAPDAYAAAAGSHCLVVATEWEEFAVLDLDALRQAMAYPVVVDARNMFDPQDMRAAGFAYYPTGRPPVLREGMQGADETDPSIIV